MRLWSIEPETQKKYTHVVPTDEFLNNDELMGKWHKIGGRPVKNKVQPIEMRKEYKSKKLYNIPYFFFNLLIMDNIAVNAFENIFNQNNVELLPLINPEHKLYAINILDAYEEKDVLDMDKSEFEFFKSSGRIMCVNKYVFVPSLVEGKDIFFCEA